MIIKIKKIISKKNKLTHNKKKYRISLNKINIIKKIIVKILKIIKIINKS